MDGKRLLRLVWALVAFGLAGCNSNTHSVAVDPPKPSPPSAAAQEIANVPAVECADPEATGRRLVEDVQRFVYSGTVQRGGPERRMRVYEDTFERVDFEPNGSARYLRFSTYPKNNPNWSGLLKRCWTWVDTDIDPNSSSRILELRGGSRATVLHYTPKSLLKFVRDKVPDPYVYERMDRSAAAEPSCQPFNMTKATAYVASTPKRLSAVVLEPSGIATVVAWDAAKKARAWTEERGCWQPRVGTDARSGVLVRFEHGVRQFEVSETELSEVGHPSVRYYRAHGAD